MCKKIPLRGALIVLEGCDRAGKTTQCKHLGNLLFTNFGHSNFFFLFRLNDLFVQFIAFAVKSLEANGHKAQYMNFPDRTTECGKLINSYLTSRKDFSDEAIHLLFTVNRWEAVNKMEQLLRDGVTLIVDRYSYSGVAFSAAKGLDFEWCKNVERGLPKPDLVLMLNMTAEAISRRGGFGDER